MFLAVVEPRYDIATRLLSTPACAISPKSFHDIDLKDDKFNRLEAAGLNAVIDGLSENVHDDRKRLQQAGAVFDGLFALFGRAAQLKTGRRTRQTSRRK